MAELHRCDNCKCLYPPGFVTQATGDLALCRMCFVSFYAGELEQQRREDSDCGPRKYR